LDRALVYGTSQQDFQEPLVFLSKSSNSLQNKTWRPTDYLAPTCTKVQLWEKLLPIIAK
jgi:hypothetical protein